MQSALWDDLLQKVQLLPEEVTTSGCCSVNLVYATVVQYD